MDPSRERLKLIVKNLKLLVDALESEVYSDVDAYSNLKESSSKITDYDEVFDDDDGYPDLLWNQNLREDIIFLGSY